MKVSYESIGGSLDLVVSVSRPLLNARWWIFSEPKMVPCSQEERLFRDFLNTQGFQRVRFKGIGVAASISVHNVRHPVREDRLYLQGVQHHVYHGLSEIWDVVDDYCVRETIPFSEGIEDGIKDYVAKYCCK
jgi:hypothetical protein